MGSTISGTPTGKAWWLWLLTGVCTHDLSIQLVYLLHGSLRLQVQVSQQTRWKPYHLSWPGFIRHKFHVCPVPFQMKQLQVHPEARGGNTDPNSQWEECQRTCGHLKTAVKRQCVASWGSQGRLHRRGGIEREMEICQGKWHVWEVILQREQHLSGLYIHREQRNVRRNVKGDYEVDQASKENQSHCFQTPWLEHVNMSEPLMQLDNCPSILKAYTFIWESIAQQMGLKWGLWRDSFFITNTEYLLFTGTILRTWWFQLI